MTLDDSSGYSKHGKGHCKLGKSTTTPKHPLNTFLQ